MGELTINTQIAKVTFSDPEEVVSVYSTPVIISVSAGGGAVTAEDVSIADAGNYYTSDNVEGALQEVGLSIEEIASNITTLQTDVTTLQGDVADIVEPENGQGITVNIDGSIDIGGGSTVAGGKTITIDTATGSIIFQASTGAFSVGFRPDEDLIEFVTNSGDTIAISTAGVELTKKVQCLQYTSTIQTLAISAGLIAWNMALGQRAKVTLTQSATLSNPTNGAAAFPDLEVLQDGTGGWFLSFGSNFVLPTTWVAPSTTANSLTLYHFQLRSDGKYAVNYTTYAS